MKKEVLKKLAKKLLGGTLTLALAASLVPMMPGAVKKVHAAECKHVSEGWEEWTSNDSLPGSDDITGSVGNFYLDTDVTLGDNGWNYIPAEKTINLCLNGHSIDLTDGSIAVNNTTLKIFDCGQTDHKGFIGEDVRWIHSNELPPGATEKHIKGGLIVGISYNSTVSIENKGKFYLEGGTITGGAGLFPGFGGGVVVRDGTFVMNGGSIENNSSVNQMVGLGGGVYVGSGSSFEMHGGKITENMAQTGGGVLVALGGRFIADGGEIKNNTALDAGGGIYAAIDAAYDYRDVVDPFTCLAAGTPITLADGSKTAIENLKIGDSVRVFNHETGALSTSKLFDLWKFPEKKGDAFTLHFTNDIDVTAVGGHCFFEKSANKYVNITKENAESFVGSEFYNADTESWEELISVNFLAEPVDTYIIVSEKTFNTLANGMLSNVDGFYNKLCNIFDLDENLKIDVAKKNAEIEKYGLWEYDSEHFQYVTEDTYNALNLQYLGVAVGKGVVTLDEIKEAGENTLNYNTDIIRPEMRSGSNIEPVSEMSSLNIYKDGYPTDPGIYLGGSVNITGNFNESQEEPEDDNLFIWKDLYENEGDPQPFVISQKVNVLESPNQPTSMEVGITLKDRGRNGEGYPDESVVDALGAFSIDGAYSAYVDNFSSDNDKYEVVFDEGALVLAEKHEHGDWSYSSIGDTLTAKCNGSKGKCKLNNSEVSLALLANNANYSGNAVKASISSTEIAAWEEADLTVPDIKYYGRGGTADPANNAAPTAIGKYTAKITPDNIVFATKDFEITDPNAGEKVTIHRYLRPDKKDWLITCNEKEIENLKAAGWKDEGALGIAGTKDTGVEVIRFYNEITGDRMYTSNEKEKQNYRDAKKYGWIEEGVAFYTGNKAKIVRYTTPTLSHLWSVSIEEQSRLDAHESEGWKKEGVAFYLN